MPASCSGCFSGCIWPRNLKARASVWRLCNASSIVTVEKSGRRPSPKKARRFISHWKEALTVPDEAVEILLVEDSPDEVALFVRTLKKAGLTARLQAVPDGKAALDFIFSTGAPVNCSVLNRPKVIFLDLKLPKVDGVEVLRRLKADLRTRTIPVV